MQNQPMGPQTTMMILLLLGSMELGLTLTYNDSPKIGISAILDRIESFKRFVGMVKESEETQQRLKRRRLTDMMRAGRASGPGWRKSGSITSSWS